MTKQTIRRGTGTSRQPTQKSKPVPETPESSDEEGLFSDTEEPPPGTEVKLKVIPDDEENDSDEESFAPPRGKSPKQTVIKEVSSQRVTRRKMSTLGLDKSTRKGKEEVDSDEDYVQDDTSNDFDAYSVKRRKKSKRPSAKRNHPQRVYSGYRPTGKQKTVYEFIADQTKRTKAKRVRLHGLFKSLCKLHKLTGTPFMFTTLGVKNKVITFNSDGAANVINDILELNKITKTKTTVLTIENVEEKLKNELIWNPEDPRAPVAQAKIDTLTGNDDEGYHFGKTRITDNLSMTRALAGVSESSDDEDVDILEAIMGE